MGSGTNRDKALWGGTNRGGQQTRGKDKTHLKLDSHSEKRACHQM